MSASRLLAVVVAGCLLAAACTPAEPQPEPEPDPSTTAVPTAEPGTPLVLPVTSLVTFAEFPGVALLDPDTPAYPGPAAPSSLDEVQVVLPLAEAVDRLTATLAAEGAAVDPVAYPLVPFVYEENYYTGIPSYVTTDVVYHLWHLVFDKTLRDLERDVLLPTVEDLVGGLLEATTAQAEDLAGTALAEDADRAAQLLQVAAAQLDLPVTPGPLAEAELDLIAAATGGAQVSPLTGGPVDYSLFTPRGHYTRDAALTRYFLAMTTLGQLAACLPGTQLCGEPEVGLRQSLLVTRALLADATLADAWQRIFEPTAFLVGLADDYTPAELAAAADAEAPGWRADPTPLADDATVLAVATSLMTTRPVQITPGSAAVRIMGTRFVLDAFVLDQLIYPNVGTAENPRELPSGLDVAAVLGSTLAAEVMDASGAPDFAHYLDQRDALTAAVAARPVEDWGATVYDAWLYALQPVLAEHGAAYPAHQRTDVWRAKGLQTALASYAELKHDTILYAKQAMAEAGGMEPQTPHGWVETEPVAFERVAAAAGLMRAGLDARGLLTAGQGALLDALVEYAGFLAGVARAELAGGAPSAADDERLRDTGAELEGFVWSTSDHPADGSEPEADQDAALVADIATADDTYLEIGTARFDRLLVVVPTPDGGWQVAAGAVNSYRELVTDQRLSDETWRPLLGSADAPARPAWLAALYGG